MKNYKFEFNGKPYVSRYVTTSSDTIKALAKFKENPRKLYGLDIETGKKSVFKSHEKAGLCPHLSFIRLIQVYDGASIYVFDLSRIKRDGDEGVRALRHFLSKEKFVAHNAIFEIKHFLNLGIEIDCICSMILGQFYETAMHSPFEPKTDKGEKTFFAGKGFGLAPLVQRHFGVVISKQQQISNWAKPKLSKEQICYAALDAILTYDLAKHLYPKVKELKMLKAYKLYKDMQYVIAEMELNGMAVDLKEHDRLIKDWEKAVRDSEKRAKKYYGEVNLRSSKQMNEWLVKRYEKKPAVLKSWPKTKTGSYSFNKNDLFDYTKDPAIKVLLEYKKYATLLSTFGKSLQEKINPKTGRLHCSFSLGHTRTGRLSSRDPNLQNMPAREGSFRHIFVAPKGMVLVVADFSQIEIRVAGEISSDPVIRRAYKEGIDLHKSIVAVLENKPLSKVTKEERQLGKAINFGLQFGMGAAKLAFYARSSYGVKMSEAQAETAWAAYHSKYSVYSKWCTKQRRKCEELGWVRTPMGKVRKLEPTEVYTKAVNTPIQGGAAEVSFYALCELRKALKKEDPDRKIKILNTVHDEILLECDELYGEFAARLLQHAMRYGMLKVFPKATGLQNLAESAVGVNWAEAK